MRCKMTILIAIFIIVNSNILAAQIKERDVLANAGSTATLSSGHTVSWTLGETFVATRSSPNLQIIVTEGFQQPTDGTVSSAIDLPDAIGKVIVSPNPTSNTLNITFSKIPLAPIHARLADASGRTVRQLRLSELTTVLDLTGLPASWYILSLTDGKQCIRGIKVVKQ